MYARLSLVALLLLNGFWAAAQTNIRRQEVRRTDTQSVVIIPESQREKIDTASIRMEKPRRKYRRFGVKIVPAAPPGMSKQELRYTDSMGRYR